MRMLAVVALLVGALAVGGPTDADPATKARATASGVTSTGRLDIPPFPTVSAAQPPDRRRQEDGSLDRAAAPVAVRAKSAVVAEASRESQIGTPFFPELEDNARRRHFRVDTNNARAFSEARDVTLSLASSAPVPVVEATSVKAAAVARCQGNQALFDTQFSVTGLKVLGRDTAVDAVDVPVPGGPEPRPSVSVRRGEAGRSPDGGVFINGLRVTIPALDVDVVLARSEATMPTPCGGERAVTEPSRVGPGRPATSRSRGLLAVAAGVAVVTVATAVVAVGRRTRRIAPGAAGR